MDDSDDEEEKERGNMKIDWRERLWNKNVKRKKQKKIRGQN